MKNKLQNKSTKLFHISGESCITTMKNKNVQYVVDLSEK